MAAPDRWPVALSNRDGMEFSRVVIATVL